tara:strand:- start:3327 stop:3503 length:177 start_codon:yes stop_codon:yes gene_type:complete
VSEVDDEKALKSSLEKNQIELLVAAKDNLEGMIIMENLLIKKLIDFIFRIKYGILEHT